MIEKIIPIFSIQIKRLFLSLSMIAFMTSCGTSLVYLKTDAQQPDEGNAIVVGSILVEPVPEWEEPDDNYWLSIWRGPVPRSEYTISLQPNKEEELLLQLPEGIYEITAIYEGKEGSMSRGYGRKGELELWFELKEGEIQYIGQLKISISPDDAFLRREKDEAVDRATRTISRAVFGQEISGKKARPLIYSSVLVEDNLNNAVELLRNKGWKESSIERLEKTFITTASPE